MIKHKNVRGIFHLQGAIFVTALLCLVLSALSGCVHTVEEATVLSPEKERPTRIAVFPFQQVFPEDMQKGATESPLTGAIFDAAKAPGSPEGILEEDFLNALRTQRPALEIVSGSVAGSLLHTVPSSSLKMRLRDALCRTGKQLGVDFVVVGYLYRFRELKGESFSAEKPASVAFEMIMLDVADGRMVWRGIFDQSQKSLMENLFQSAMFWRGRGKWLKAGELAKQGLEEVMKTFPVFPPLKGL